MKDTAEHMIELIAKHYSADVSRYDPSFLERTVRNRMTLLNLHQEEDYLELLEQNPEEGALFVSSLQVNVSEFFRNQLTFSYLRQIILPWILERKRQEKEKEIRIWSAACAEGQEAYSLAILWQELADSIPSPVTCRIFATDINKGFLREAAKGVYPESMLKNVTLEQVAKFFNRTGSTYSVLPKIKDLVSFSEFDLLTEQCSCPPESIFGNFDLIICSNLLFYFRPVHRQRILEKVGHCLAKDGYFITGETERDLVFRPHYREVFPYSGIFQQIRNRHQEVKPPPFFSSETDRENA